MVRERENLKKNNCLEVRRENMLRKQTTCKLEQDADYYLKQEHKLSHYKDKIRAKIHIKMMRQEYSICLYCIYLEVECNYMDISKKVKYGLT